MLLLQVNRALMPPVLAFREMNISGEIAFKNDDFVYVYPGFMVPCG